MSDNSEPFADTLDAFRALNFRTDCVSAIERTDVESFKNTLKFTSTEYPPDKYEILHPCIRTVGADLVILPALEDTNSRQVVIPVDKSFMKVIPYFKRQFKQNVWKETKSITTPAGIKGKSVLNYIQSLYDSLYNEHHRKFGGTSAFPKFTEDNCLDIFELSDYWCDQHMKRRVETYLVKRMTTKIFMAIVNKPSLVLSLQNTLKLIADKKFEKIKVKKEVPARSRSTITLEEDISSGEESSDDSFVIPDISFNPSSFSNARDILEDDGW